MGPEARAYTPDQPLGLIAGRGDYPLEFCRAARRAGVTRLVVLAMHQETAPEIGDLADHIEWYFVGQIQRAIDALLAQGVRHVILTGQIRPHRLFTGIRPDLRAVLVLRRLRVRNAESIFSAVAAEFERDGIAVLPSTTFMEESLAGEGVLGSVVPRPRVRADIEYGVRVAREVSRLDIGQTVVVRQGTVLAVEGFEGTDRAIRRGGELGHGGVVVVKVAKPGHDIRFDVPCVGLKTVDSLRMARAKALAVQAGLTLFVGKPAVLAACDAAGIAVVGVRIADA